MTKDYEIVANPVPSYSDMEQRAGRVLRPSEAMTKYTKPELGKLSMGDELLVTLPSNRWTPGGGLDNPVRVTVIKVARVWVTMEETEQASSRKRTWRMRLDTQHGEDHGGQRARFLTPAQYDFEKVQRGAREYLREQGVKIDDYRSEWRGREVDLAMAMQAFEAQHAETEEQP